MLTLKPNHTILGKRLKSVRTDKGMTIRACARLLGVSPPALQDIEEGRTRSPGLSIVQAIASFADLSVDELLGDDQWVCVPRELHDAATALDLPYRLTSELNGRALRSAVNSTTVTWNDLIEIARQRPEFMQIIEQHPDSAPTVALTVKGEENRAHK